VIEVDYRSAGVIWPRAAGGHIARDLIETCGVTQNGVRADDARVGYIPGMGRNSSSSIDGSPGA
jgi:hypothetical protein